MRQSKTPVLRGLAILLVTALVAAGCSHTRASRVRDPDKLRHRVEGFHRFLRWEMYNRASKSIQPEFRNTFLGRYEEYGDDLDILNLKVERVDRRAKNERVVKVEQRWVMEPDMTVEEESFVELWTRTDKGWMLRDRMEEKEWERRQKSDEPASDAESNGETTASKR